MLRFNQKSNPDVFWVLSSSTDSGKTTLSAALIRHLNRIGHPTVGFKPFAGGKFRDIIDFAMVNYPQLPNSVFGSDGLQLCRASPLTEDSDVDLVSPWQLIFYENYLDTVIIRAGSMALGNVEYFKSSLADTLKERADIHRISTLLKLPFDKAATIDKDIPDRSILAAHVRQDAFGELLKRQPDVVVVESAGAFVPYWEGSPLPDHIIFINDFSIRIYPHVTGLNMGEIQYSHNLEAELVRQKIHSYRIDQFYVEAALRDETLERLLSVLLKGIND